MGKVPINEIISGHELEIYRELNNFITIGVSKGSKGYVTSIKTIDIHPNLILLESLRSSFNIKYYSVCSQFSFLKRRWFDFFVSANIGVRTTKFTTKYRGHFFVFAMRDNIFDDRSQHMFAEIHSGLQLFLSDPSKNHFAIKLRSGIHTGSSMNYIENDDIYYENSKFHFDARKKSNASYWVNSVGLAYRFKL